MNSIRVKSLITIERGPGMAASPIYSAKIYPDGTVIYKGERFVKVEGERRYPISEEKVQKLVDAFESSKYLSFEDKSEMMVTCCSETVTSFRYGGRSKKVENTGLAPRWLDRLEDLIDEVAGLTELIGERDF